MSMTYTITAKLTSTTDAGSVHTNNISTSGAMTAESGSDSNTALQQAIGTAWEAIQLGDVDTSKRYIVCVRNPSTNDTAKPLTVKFQTTVAPAYGPEHVLYPGELLVITCPPLAAGYPILGALFTTTAQNAEIVACDAGTPVY